MSKKATALNESLEALLDDLAKKQGVDRETALLRSVTLLKFLNDRGARKVKAFDENDNELNEVEL